MKRLLCVITLILISSCTDSQTEDTNLNAVAPSNLEYPTPFYENYFLQKNISETPNIDWGCHKGTFSILPKTEGLSIDKNTGVLTYENLLPPKMHYFNVIAKNSTGQIDVSMRIHNRFEATFIGTYNDEKYLELNFFDNETVRFKFDNSPNPAYGHGIWKMTNKNTFLVNFLDETGIQYSLKGSIELIDNTYTFKGNYYNGYNAETSNLISSFETSLLKVA